MRLEHRRGRLVLHLGKLKLEYTIEPRYWRNPWIGVAFLILLPIAFLKYPDYMALLSSANVYAAIAIPLAWQMTGIGRMNFGPQFFVGIGGFSAALLSIHLGWGPWQTLGVVVFISFAFGLLISPLTTLAKGLYFSLITLILPLMFLEITFVYTKIFQGETGLSGIAPLFTFGDIRVEQIIACYFSLGLMLVYLLVVEKILNSRVGLYAAAINDEEEVAETCGLNINFWKMLCFTITSVMVGIVGWFVAHHDGVFCRGHVFATYLHGENPAGRHYRRARRDIRSGCRRLFCGDSGKSFNDAGRGQLHSVPINSADPAVLPERRFIRIILET